MKKRVLSTAIILTFLCGLLLAGTTSCSSSKGDCPALSGSKKPINNKYRK